MQEIGDNMTRDYWPQGDGVKDCKICGGRGVVPAPDSKGPVPATMRCQCVIIRDTVDNMERGWRGLIKAQAIKDSPLKELTDTNLLITASDQDFRSHMKHTAARMGSNWDFKVITDKDLMTAWLASVALKGQEILDPDAASTSLKYLTIEDLVEPPEIVIIRLGIKAARNVAMAEVLNEALSHRAHLSKTTWVTDQPSYRLNSDHICYSDAIEDLFRSWDRILLTDPKSKKSVRSSVISSKPLPQTHVQERVSAQTRNVAEEMERKAKEAEKRKRSKKWGK